MLRPSLMLALASLVFAASTTRSDAFAPMPSFPQHRQPSHVASEPETKLSMSLTDRFVRVAKANVNTVLNSIEAPEKIIAQAVEDMQMDLARIRASYAEIKAAQRRLIKQKENSEYEAESWYVRAQLALQNSNEELAREALARRQQLIDSTDVLREQIDTQAASIDKLYDGMKALEGKIMEAKSKKEQYIARAKKAKLTKEVNEMNNAKISGTLSSLGTSSAMEAFARMEEKVEALEAAAEASAELIDSGEVNVIAPGADKVNVELEFKALERSAGIEEELTKLKGLLSAGKVE